MSTAHLHAVPDPDEPPPPVAACTPGKGTVEFPVPAASGEGLETPGEAAPRALAMPDLRPYVTVDRATVKEAGRGLRSAARGLRHGLARPLRHVRRILRAGALVVLLAARHWFTGDLGPTVPPLWRLFILPGLAIYAAAYTAALFQWTALLPLLPAWLLMAVTVDRWAAAQAARAARAVKAKPPSGKGTGKDGTDAAAEGAGENPTESPDTASGKPGKSAAKEGSKKRGKGAPPTFAARLAAALAPRSPEPAEEPGATPATTPAEEAGEEPEETPTEEAPAAPSRDDIARALHTLVGDSSGVLDTALRDHLRYPSTRAVREALEAAGIAHRPGVRAASGNGPGVHHSDFPPLPPPQEGPPGSGVAAGQEPTTTPTTRREEPRERFRVVRNDHGMITIHDRSESRHYRTD